jgi:hypothetical protein
LDKHAIFKYNIRQRKAGSNGSFMYGIGTKHIKGLNRAQDSKYFIGYYELTGNVYEQGTSRKGGPKIKDGETVTIVVDLRKWKVYWYVEGKREAEAGIGEEMRDRSLCLAFVIFNNESEL